MSLTLVPTPIGHSGDWTLRAITALKEADLVIVEEFREGSTYLKQLDITSKKMEQLNEHSSDEDIDDLLNLCKEKNVCLISDCGTPNFCDPGAKLVQLCRQNRISVKSLPGASSLMTLLSLSSQRLNEFVFVGFLPAEKTARSEKLKALKTEKRPMVLMDTPYRLKKLVEELSAQMPKRLALLALDLTQETENILEAKLEEMPKQIGDTKAEFLILIYGQ